jgi:Patatin-like phospholipase
VTLLRPPFSLEARQGRVGIVRQSKFALGCRGIGKHARIPRQQEWSTRTWTTIRIALTIQLVALTGCASVMRVPYTHAMHNDAHIPGVPNARVWADDVSRSQWLFSSSHHAMRALAVLALSGGGAEGAYGAGFLKGWSETGTRPEFTVVTGTSVGALIAPFAFLGSTYDDTLKTIFNSGEIDNLLRIDGLNGLLGSGIFKTAPLRQLISRYADESLLEAIASEHRRGRRLFVVTTNVDAQRTVIWNMSGIAASDYPGRLELFRTILVASASVPGVFSPVLIDVEADGQLIAEMHVDGGVTTNVLAVPEALLLSKLPVKSTPKPQLFIIVNGKLAPDFDIVDDTTLSVVARSFWTTVKANTRNTLIATYDFARRNSWEFRATAIDANRQIATKTINFDTDYVRGLFAYGLTRGQSGAAWQRTVPSIAGSGS